MRGAFLEGVERFNDGRFWDAHESWEAIWLQRRGDEGDFVRGLIQAAAACHHLRRGTLRGAVRLLEASLARLGRYPDGFGGVRREELQRQLTAAQGWAVSARAGAILPADLVPRLALTPDWEERLRADVGDGTRENS